MAGERQTGPHQAEFIDWRAGKYIEGERWVSQVEAETRLAEVARIRTSAETIRADTVAEIVAFIRERSSLLSFDHQRAPYRDMAEAVENEFGCAGKAK